MPDILSNLRFQGGRIRGLVPAVAADEPLRKGEASSGGGGGAPLVVGATWENGATAVVAGEAKTIFVTCNAPGTIEQIEIVTDNSVSGACVVDIWKANNAYPSVADSIISGTKPGISGGRYHVDDTLTDLSTTEVAAGDRIGLHLDSCSLFTILSIRITIGS